MVGTGAIAGAVISIVEIFQAHAPLRGFLWPLQLAGASLAVAIAALIVAGLGHPAAWLVVVVAGTVQALGDYESENYYLPLLGLGVVTLVFAYRQSRARLRTLSRTRLTLLALALLSALLGIAQMQAPTDRMSWDRVRRDGAIEVRTFVSAPPCAPPSAEDLALIDQGCEVVIPRARAWWVVGYAAAAMVLGAAAVAGAREGERFLARSAECFGEDAVRDTATEHLGAFPLRDAAPDAVAFAVFKRERQTLGASRAHAADLFGAPCLVVGDGEENLGIDAAASAFFLPRQSSLVHDTSLEMLARV